MKSFHPKTTSLRLLSACLLAAGLSTHAWADGDLKRMPAGAPKAFQAECASCHTAYSPKLLPAASWGRIMDKLDKHYGLNATLSVEETRDIKRWLMDNAATKSKRMEEPPSDRITESAWFKKEHRRISQATWAKPAIKSPSNCAACHTQADQGRFDDDHLRIPR
jgi:nitrate/TMAO reductase-like tetraheme cytochrome c subunit